MNIIPTEILKYAIAIIPLIIQIFAVRSGWVFPKDKIFTSRKNISEFAAALHKNSDDPDLQRIAYEYGIAALTKDKNLTMEQRKILLKCKNPVSDIDNYSKCQHLISVNNEKRIFKWKKPGYRFWLYRKCVEVISLALYFIGGFLTALPFLYEGLASPAVIERINHLSRLQKFCMASYLFACGVCLALICLHKLSTLSDRGKNHQSESLTRPSPGDLSTSAAPNPVDNLEAVVRQPQPGRATGCRSFFEQGNRPRRAARLARKPPPRRRKAPAPLNNSTSAAPPCFSSADRGTLSDRVHCCARAYR